MAKFGVFIWNRTGVYREVDSVATYKLKHAAQNRADKLNQRFEGLGNYVVRTL